MAPKDWESRPRYVLGTEVGSRPFAAPAIPRSHCWAGNGTASTISGRRFNLRQGGGIVAFVLGMVPWLAGVTSPSVCFGHPLRKSLRWTPSLPLKGKG